MKALRWKYSAYSFAMLLHILWLLLVTACSIALQTTQLLVYVLLQLIRDIGGAAIVAAATTIWLKIWTTLASKGRVDSKVSRKVIHCG